MKNFNQNPFGLTTGQIAVMTKEQLIECIKLGVELALETKDTYESKFEGLPPILSQQQVCNFLGKSRSAVQAWRVAGKIEFEKVGKERPKITLTNFIATCKKNNWV